MNGVSESSAKETEKGRGNENTCMESMGWGTIGTTVDDGVRRCRVRAWVLVLGRVPVGEGMGGAWRIGGTIGGIFLPPAYELKCAYAQVHIVQLGAFLCMIFEFW